MNQDADKLLTQIKDAAKKNAGEYLTYQRFRRITDVPWSRILAHFDSWTAACAAAGVRCGLASPTNLTPRYSKGRDHAIQEVKRVAHKLGVETLSKSQFDRENPKVKAQTVAKLCGGWLNALVAAGLRQHPLHYDRIELKDLASEFLQVVRELGKIPTVHQMARKSSHGLNTFARKFRGYVVFKQRAIEYLLRNSHIPTNERDILECEQRRSGRADKPNTKQASARPHATGKHLGFRAFANVPTYEAEVVSLFGNVAQELGFQIVAQRPQFPDCEARRITNKKRRRYKKCMIEFEVRSSDYVAHHHPIKGCDLIVCWVHDWSDCPLECLELRSEISRLRGWE